MYHSQLGLASGYKSSPYTPLVEVNQAILAWSYRQNDGKLVVLIGDDNSTTFGKWPSDNIGMWA